MVGPFKREGRRDSSDDLSNRTERILIGVIGLVLPLLPSVARYGCVFPLINSSAILIALYAFTMPPLTESVPNGTRSPFFELIA
jgi:hypothetical protein